MFFSRKKKKDRYDKITEKVESRLKKKDAETERVHKLLEKYKKNKKLNMYNKTGSGYTLDQKALKELLSEQSNYQKIQEKKLKEKIKKDLDEHQNLKKVFYDSFLENLKDHNKALDEFGYDKNGYDKNGYDKNGKDKNNFDKKLMVSEKEKISLTILKNALEKEYPTELITEKNRESYIYFMQMLLNSSNLNKLSQTQYRNLMFLADIYGLKKSEVIF